MATITSKISLRNKKFEYHNVSNLDAIFCFEEALSILRGLRTDRKLKKLDEVLSIDRDIAYCLRIEKDTYDITFEEELTEKDYEFIQLVLLSLYQRN